MRVYLVILLFLLSGCGLFRPTGYIKGIATSVMGVKDAGKPATLNETKATQGLTIPAGSAIVVTKHEAEPFRAATEKTPEFPGAPAFETVDIRLAKDTQWVKNDSTVQANTGTVDASVALHRIDVASKGPLLWGALGCMGLAALFVYLHYKTPAMLAGIAAVVCFIAWKVADVPPWIWGVAVAAVAVGAGLYFGYEKKETELKQASTVIIPPAPVATPPTNAAQ